MRILTLATYLLTSMVSCTALSSGELSYVLGTQSPIETLRYAGLVIRAENNWPLEAREKLAKLIADNKQFLSQELGRLFYEGMGKLIEPNISQQEAIERCTRALSFFETFLTQECDILAEQQTLSVLRLMLLGPVFACISAHKTQSKADGDFYKMRAVIECLPDDIRFASSQEVMDLSKNNDFIKRVEARTKELEGLEANH